jgi:MFS family permease
VTRPSISHAWRALRHRNFQLFYAGQSISVIGTWMTRLATSWLVYQMTHSALMLGVVGFSGQIISLLLGPFAGVWVERLPRRKMLVWTQAAGAVQSLALAGLTLTHRITVPEIIVLSAFQGLINAFDMPGRQSFLVQMIDDRKDLQNAIALNSSMANGARFIGPAIAGMIVAKWGEGWCFLIDGVSYFAVIVSLLMMHVAKLDKKRVKKSLFEDMREGWDYVRGFAPVRTTLILFATIAMMGYSVTTLLPVFAAQILHGGAHTLGWLSSAVGVGAVISAASLTLRKSVRGLPRAVQVSSALAGAGLVAFGFSHLLWTSLVLLVFVGFGMMQTASASNTIVQSLVTDEKRARVMSYYTMAFFGSVPIGSLLSGAMAHVIGAQHTVMVTGTCCVLGAVWYSARLPKMKAALQPTVDQEILQAV